MLSIPSPDVVVNLFASLGQLLALLTLVVGGAAVSSDRRARRGHGRAPRGLLYATAGLAVASWVAFFLYYTHVEDLRTARLRANLSRVSVEKGRSVGGTSLKTLAFSEQVSDPLGVSTEELAAWLRAGTPVQLLDIREAEETERGRLPGSRHIRYPDLREVAEQEIDPARPTVLLCYSGNRSSELAKEFEKRGIPCMFMIGGYEKWISTGGALADTGGAARAELRELPPTPNSDVLLDTPEAIEAIGAGATFVDVRYEEDYDRGHLPGAINLPIRKLSSAELTQAISELPKTPIIAVCYDRRSSFYGLILALRVHRAGGTFAGRYTVPHEYPSAVRSRAHVAAWQAERQGVTLLGMVQEALGAALGWLQDLCGSLGLAILVLVALLRGLLLPLSFKADRDQLRRQRLASEVQALREQYATDPGRAQRATMALFRRAGLTPGRNFAVAIGLLVLFLSFFGVVQSRAQSSTEVFLGWVLGAADPIGVLPVVVGVLMGGIVCNVRRVSRSRLVLAAALAIFLAAITWPLTAAVNLYLVVSLGWVLIQGRIARRLELSTRVPRRRVAGVVTLKEATGDPATGNKAIHLGRMQAAGLPVPDGFVVTDRALRSAGRDGAMLPADRRAVARLHRRLRCERVAVRSSGLKEDGGDKSYAGVFESVLDVTAENLFEAIDFVRRSMHSDRAQVYGDGDEHGGIVVQEMVPAEYAGVLFTEHPGCSGSMLVEMVDGLCEQLVGGTVTPKGFEFTRRSGELIGAAKPPIDLAPLLELGRKVERLFGGPQDIEWAFEGGRFYLLQARDVTVRAGSGRSPEALRHRERARLLDLAEGALADDVVFAQNELSELLPDPTPFSLAFMNDIWSPGGSVDRACRSLGVPYDVSDECSEYAVDVFGKLYVNRREEARRMGKGLSGMASFRLTRCAEALEREYRDEVLPAFGKRIRLLEATDPARLSDASLLELWQQVREEFVTSTYVEAERINIAADFFVKTATEQLVRRGHNPAVVLADIPETVVHRAFGMLPEVADGTIPHSAFLDLFGHRAPHDFELSGLRYAEDAAAVERLVRAAARPAAATRERVGSTVYGKVLQLRLDRARRFQSLKEAAKHEAMRELAVFRALTLEIGRRARLGERIFWLTPAEVAALRPDTLRQALPELEAKIDARIDCREACESVELPVRLTLRELEVMRLDDGPVLVRNADSEELVGKRVAGEGEAVGRVRVIENVAELDDFVPGEILVTRFTDPTWSTVFPVAGGLVTEVGGWLSHAAIQAREYGLACVVDVAGAVRSLRTGDIVRLDLDGRVRRLDAASGVLEQSTDGRVLRFKEAAG